MLGLILALLFGSLAAGVRWGAASWSPGLALDLEGGTQVILTPVSTTGADVTQENLEEAVNIISQRVNATGVTEAEVSILGGRDISVSIPGTPSRETLDLVRQSAQLRFRPVLTVAGGAPLAEPVLTPADPAAPTDPAVPAEPPAPVGPAEPVPSPEATGAVVPQALRAAPAPDGAAPPTGAAVPDGAAPPAPDGAAAPTDAQGAFQPEGTPTPAPTSNSDAVWLSLPEVQQAFAALDCTDPRNRTGGFIDDPATPLVTCSQDGASKFVLGPADLQGTAVTSATAAQAQNDQGFATGGWEVQLDLDRQGATAFEETTERLAALPEPQNRFGIVLDGLVVVAPSVSGPIPGGNARITGDFSQAEAQTLANQLKFGALPLSFEVQTEDQVSATLGEDQLQRGLLAGLIGLVLVVLYSLLQYRALGLVTVGSLSMAAAITYGVIALASWQLEYRLSLAGVAGLIVAIGVTADSFIVFFERVRDEVREGRALASAVEVGWHRARRTILISGAVTFLAAVILAVLAVGNVAGFAVTLGITTIVDVLVVFLFTHPVVALLARTSFFGGGHRLSGFDPVHLGSVVARSAPRSGARRETIAARKAAARTRALGTDEEGSA